MSECSGCSTGPVARVGGVVFNQRQHTIMLHILALFIWSGTYICVYIPCVHMDVLQTTHSWQEKLDHWKLQVLLGAGSLVAGHVGEACRTSLGEWAAWPLLQQLPSLPLRLGSHSLWLKSRHNSTSKQTSLPNVHEERLGNILRELWKTGSHPGLNQGPLTLPSVLYHLSYGHQVTASLHNSQYHSVCAVRIPLGIDQ